CGRGRGCASSACGGAPCGSLIAGDTGAANWATTRVAPTARKGRPMFGIPIGELAMLAVAVAGGGVVTGIMAGMFGIGGGAVIVPVLYEVFGALGVAEDIRMQLCIGTSLAIIVPTTFRSYF